MSWGPNYPNLLPIDEAHGLSARVKIFADNQLLGKCSHGSIEIFAAILRQLRLNFRAVSVLNGWTDLPHQNGRGPGGDHSSFLSDSFVSANRPQSIRKCSRLSQPEPAGGLVGRDPCNWAAIPVSVITFEIRVSNVTSAIGIRRVGVAVLVSGVAFAASLCCRSSKA